MTQSGERLLILADTLDGVALVSVGVMALAWAALASLWAAGVVH